MKKGIGKAMEVGISPRFQPEIIPEEEISLLYSTKRLRIIEFLAGRPCATLSSISEGTGISQESVRWHVKQLVENLLLEECAPRRYSPPNMVPYEWTALFVALHNPVEARVIKLLIERGSMKAREIRRAMDMKSQNLSYHLRKLLDFGVLKKEEGYYSVDVDVLDIQERAVGIAEEFVANLLLKARMQGVSMEMRREGHMFVITVKGREELKMSIPEVPFPDILG